MGESMSLTALAKQRMLRMETYAKFPYLIEITRYAKDGTEEIYRYANSFSDMEFEGNVFSSGYFEIEQPEKRKDGFSDARLTISAIDTERNWIGLIRSTSKRAKLRFVATIEYDDEDETFVEPINDYEFMLTVASWNDTAIQWTLKFDDLMDVQIPCDEITVHNTPSLG